MTVERSGGKRAGWFCDDSGARLQFSDAPARVRRGLVDWSDGRSLAKRCDQLRTADASPRRSG